MDKLNKRWIYVLNGFIMLLLLGLIYAWSIFSSPLEQEFGWTRSQTSMTFTICMCMFCIGGLVAGIVAKKKTPAFIMRCCAVLVCMGFVLTARIHTLSGLYIYYGILVGFGVGLAYNAIISSVTKWFPEETGFISGLLLMGFGFGGMVLGTISTTIIQSLGWRKAFTSIGMVLGLFILLGSFLTKVPSKMHTTSQSSARKKSLEVKYDFSTKSMLSTSSFWLFFIWAIVLSAAGLAMIGHAAPCAIDLGVSLNGAALLSGLISLFNGAGRVIVGLIYDKVGQKKTMFLVSLSFILTSIILLLALTQSSLFLLILGYILTGFSYGGIMPCNSSVIYTFYGRKHYALNFSMINMNIIFASILGPFLAGLLQTTSGSYLTTFITMLLFGAIAFMITLILKEPHYSLYLKKEEFKNEENY